MLHGDLVMGQGTKKDELLQIPGQGVLKER